jgi:hypothetical protein
LQGKNKTFYGGSLLSFEFTDCVVGWTTQFVQTRMRPDLPLNFPKLSLLEKVLQHDNSSSEVQCFLANLRRFPDKPVFGNLNNYNQNPTAELMTMQDLANRAGKIIKRLRSQGYDLGTKVAILYELDSMEIFPAVWACLLGGFISVPLAPPK